MNIQKLKVADLQNWEKNPRRITKKAFDFSDRKYSGLLKGHGWNKGKGMTEEEKKDARKKTLMKYNNSEKAKIRVGEWHEKNKDRVKEIKEKYANSERGKEKRKECGQRRLAIERNLKVKLNMDYWRWLCERLDYKCQICGSVKKYTELTIDHQIPINLGGDNHEWNLQPLCKSCNCRKQDRLIGVDNYILDIAYGDWLLMKQGINLPKIHE